MTRAWLLVLAACGSRTTASVPPAPSVPPLGPRPAAAPARTALESARPMPPRPPLHGVPEDVIAALALTPDGAAALTTGGHGDWRLWTPLDGTREPSVVDLPRLASPVIAADARGFLVAGVDDAGGLVMQVVGADGVGLARATLAPEPRFRGVALTAHGTVAWAEDETILAISPDGAVAGRLATGAGEHVRAILPAAGRALVVLESPAKDPKSPPDARARWLDASPLAWGDWVTAPDASLGGLVAVSPSGARLAYAMPRQPGVRVVDLATNAVLGAPQLQTLTLSSLGGLAFADEDHVAVVPGELTAFDRNGITWLALGGPPPAPTPVTQEPPVPIQPDPRLAAGGGRVVYGSGWELAIGAPAGDPVHGTTAHLGYGLASVSDVVALPNGHALALDAEHFAELDGALAGAEIPPARAFPDEQLQVLALGGGDWLVAHGPEEARAVELVRGAPPAATQKLLAGTETTRFAYEPSTHLVTIADGDASTVWKYDPAAHALAKVAAAQQLALHLTNPALAGGAQLVSVKSGSKLAVRWVRDAAKPEADPPLWLEGAIAAVDAAGHVYLWAWERGTRLVLAVYTAGTRTGTIPLDEVVNVFTDPAGAKLLLVGAHDLAVVTSAGAPVWRRTNFGIVGGAWLVDGGLLLRGPAGVVRVDGATGAIRGAACGWLFGLTAGPHELGTQGETICTELPD